MSIPESVHDRVIDELLAANKEIARLKAELAHVQQEYLDLAEASTGQVDLVNKLRMELAGSENNRQALGEALDGINKTLTETQNALDESQAKRVFLEKFIAQAGINYNKVVTERDTANELLKELYKLVKHLQPYMLSTRHDERIAAHLKPKEEHVHNKLQNEKCAPGNL